MNKKILIKTLVWFIVISTLVLLGKTFGTVLEIDIAQNQLNHSDSDWIMYQIFLAGKSFGGGIVGLLIVLSYLKDIKKL